MPVEAPVDQREQLHSARAAEMGQRGQGGSAGAKERGALLPVAMEDVRLYREVPHPRYCKDPDNRYSTYVIDGLPPGPIANPGRAALAAALRPTRSAEAEKLLYFVARRDGTGEHHFSETHDEHRRAVQRFLVDRETATAEAR